MSHIAPVFPKPSFELSPIKAIELAAARIPGSISLAQGIPSFATPKVITDFVIDRIQAGVCDKYSLTTGLAELREEIASSLAEEGLRTDPDREIIVTAGSIEGISAAILASTSPGDEVILPSPTYTSYNGAIGLARAIPVHAPLDEDSNFDFDIDEIERRITKRTRVILFCSPNNPTGTVYSQERTNALVALAERYGLRLIIDEVYKDFYYTDEKHISALYNPRARPFTIRVCSFSKAYAMTGWRVGFLHGDRALVEPILKYHDALVTCAPVASQYAALAALRHGRPCVQHFREQFRLRRDATLRELEKLSDLVDVQVPRATYFVFPRIKDRVPLSRDSHKLAYDILAKVGVAVVPGVAFGPTGESHLRINFGRDEGVLMEGLSRLADYFRGAGSSKGAPPSSTPSQKAVLRRSESIAPVPFNLARTTVKFLLANAAKVALLRKRPSIIAVIGNQGKTVTKRTIAKILEQHHSVRSNILSYNTAVGVPLSILGIPAPSRRSEWPITLVRAWSAAFLQTMSANVLVLEYGVVSPRDAYELLAIAKPDWVVLTNISSIDPSLNRESLLGGIKIICEAVSTNRRFGAGENFAILGLDHNESVMDELDLAALQAARAAVPWELVGQSAQDALTSGVALNKLIRESSSARR